MSAASHIGKVSAFAADSPPEAVIVLAFFPVYGLLVLKYKPRNEHRKRQPTNESEIFHAWAAPQRVENYANN